VSAVKGLLVVDERIPTRAKLRATLQGLTAALARTDFGDPVEGDTSYALCLYDAQGLGVAALEIDRAQATCGPFAAPCWKSAGAFGLRYADRDGTVHGVRRIVLESGPAGTGKAVFKARVHPARSVSGLPAGLASALVTSPHTTVQLVSSDAACFTLTTDVVVDADPARFSAKRR
jgi:hypothetical protein